MSLIEKKEQADNLLLSMTNDRQALNQGLKELERSKESLRVETGRLEELRSVLEKKKESFDLREQTVNDALKGITPKMKEIEERERALQESLEKLGLDTVSIKDREKACEESEKRLEGRDKTQGEREAQLDNREARDRKKGLDLVTWEQALTAKEDLLKKRERAISGAKKEELVSP